MFKIIIIMLGAILVILLVGGGYLYYKLSNSEVFVIPTTKQGSDFSTETGASASANNETGDAPSASVPATGFTIDVSTLPESQHSIIRTLGFGDTVTFTPEMVACAEAKLGVVRVTEIINGASPSIIESTKLVPCL